MLAVMTGFRRGKEPVNLDQSASVPRGFIFELTDELTPSHIGYGHCQTVIFDHILDCQTLDTYHLVFVNNASRELMLVVTPTVIDTSMDMGYFETGLVPVPGTFFLSCVPSLCFCQTLFVFCIVARIAYGLTGREDHHRLETQIKPNLRTGDGKRLDLLLDQERDKVAICAILGDGDRTGFASFGQGTMEGDSKGQGHLGKGELTILPLESIGGKRMSTIG
jgi:hypothetical protein